MEIASLNLTKAMEEMLSEPLPSPWSYGVMSDGRVFFINEELHTTTWLHPLYNHPVQTGNLFNHALSNGWEVNLASSNVPYFIDHVNRLTTFQSPVEESPPVAKSKERKSFRLQRSSSKRKSGKQKIIDKMASVKRDADAPVSCKGWIARQEGIGPLKAWKRRWCVLADFCLFIYKGSDEGQTLGSLLLPSFKINPCFKDEDGISKKYAFKAEHENVKTSFFAVDTEEEMALWMEALRAAASAQFHPVDDSRLQFARSQSQNAINSPRTFDAQNSPDPKDAEPDLDLGRYPRRQNSMPTGMDILRQDIQDAKPRLEVQDTRPDNIQVRPGGLQHARPDETVRDAIPAKTSDYWNQKAPRQSSEHKNMSSSSDDDFMYMKDLNLSHSASAGISAKGTDGNRKQVVGPPHNDYYSKPTARGDRMDLTPGLGVPLRDPPQGASLSVRDPPQGADGPTLGSRGELSESSSGQMRYRQQQQNERPSAFPRYTENADASHTLTSPVKLSQKLPGPANSASYSGSGLDSRYARSHEQNVNSPDRGRQLRGSDQKPPNVAAGYDPGANTEFFRNGSPPTAKNAEAEVLREIQMQNPLNRATGEASRMHGMPDARYGPASTSAFDRSLNETRMVNPSEKLTSGSEGSVREKGSETSSGKVDEWSVKRLEVQKPLSRVEEWTLEQMRQQQEKLSLEPRNDGRLDRERNSNFDPKYQRQLESQGNLQPVQKRWPEEPAARQSMTTRSMEPSRVSPDRTIPSVNSNSFGGVGAGVPVPMPRKQMQGHQMERNQLPDNQMQSNDMMQGDRLHGGHMQGNQLPKSQMQGNEMMQGDRLHGGHLQGSQLPRSQMPGNHTEGNWLPEGQIQRNQGNQMERGQIQVHQRGQPAENQRQQTSVKGNNSEVRIGRPSANDGMLPNRNSSAGLASLPVTTSSQNDFVSPAFNAATSFRTDSGAQSRQTNTSAETLTYFADVNRLLVEHSKLCRDSAAPPDGSGQPLSMDDLIGRLIQLRRSQTKLEESRYWLLGQMHQQFTQSAQGTALQRVPAKAQQDKLVEVELEITNTISLVAELDRKLTSLRPKEMMGVHPSSLLASAEEPNARAEQPTRNREPEKELSSSVVSSVKEKDVNLEKKLQDIYVMQRQLEQESFFVNNLREEKSKLEKALSKAQRDEELERDPNQLMRLRRQKQAIDRELYSLQTKLTYAVRNLDEIKKKYSEMEHEAMVLRKQNYDRAGDIATSKSPVFTSLPGETTVKSYNAVGEGSEATTYYETDMDTGRSRDLATSRDTSIVENQGRDRLAGPKPSAFPSGRGIGIKSNIDASVHSSNAESAGFDSSKGRLLEASRQPYDMTGNRREDLSSSTDFKLQGNSDDKRDIRAEDLLHMPHHISKPSPENQSVSQRWLPNHTIASRDRTGFQSDEPSERGAAQSQSVLDEISFGGNGGRSNDVAFSQVVTKSQPANDPRGYEARQLGRTGLGLNTPSTQLGGFRSDAAEPLRSNNILNRLLGSGQQGVAYGQQSTTHGQPLAPGSGHGPSQTIAGSVPGGVKPSKPPRQSEEGTEWHKETYKNINFRLRPLLDQASATEASRRPEDDRQKTSNIHLDFSGSGVENKETVAQGPRSSSVPRRPLDDPTRPNYSPENVDRSAPKSQESDRDQSSPTNELGQRGHIRRLSGFFTPKPFRGGSTGPGSTKMADETSGYSSSAKAGSNDPTSPIDQAFDQHIDGIFHAPQKIEIPERYIEDADDEAVSPEEALRRREKSEKLRKMVAAQSLQEFSRDELTTQTGGLQYRVQDERRRREQMLDTRQMLAEQVIRRTRPGSEHTNRTRTIETLLKDSDDGQYL